MSYFSVLSVTPTNEDWIPGYLSTVTPIVERHGGKYLARTISHERLEGAGEDAAVRVIIEWPEKESALNFMADPEYAPLLKARTDGSLSHHFLIEGKDDVFSE